MNIFHSSLQDMLEQFELQFPSNFENNDNSNVFIGEYLSYGIK